MLNRKIEKMYKKIICGLLMFIGFLPMVIAQDVAKVKEILTNISHNYDTSTNLSFSVRFTNSVEPQDGKIKIDKVEGTYALQGKNAFYTMGNIEAMQNDSFFIAVYNEDKFVLVSQPKNNGNAQFFPFRETMDSLLKLSATKYDIISVTNKKEKLGTITFAAKDTSEKVKEFRLEYNTSMGLITSIRYLFNEYKPVADGYKEENPAMELYKKTMLIEFANYSHQTIAASLLKETNYIFFEAGECKLANKFDGYKLYYSPAAEVKK
jgi:hypothetical protein